MHGGTLSTIVSRGLRRLRSRVLVPHAAGCGIHYRSGMLGTDRRRGSGRLVYCSRALRTRLGRGWWRLRVEGRGWRGGG